jgi:hypothetical protein
MTMKNEEDYLNIFLSLSNFNFNFVLFNQGRTEMLKAGGRRGGGVYEL